MIDQEIFESVSDRLKAINTTIERYNTAEKQDRAAMDQIELDAINQLNSWFDNITVKKTGGDLITESATLHFSKNGHSLFIELEDHLTCVMPRITSEEIANLSNSIVPILLNKLPKLSEFIEERIIKFEPAAAGDLYHQTQECIERKRLLEKKIKATNKWFIQPILITEEKIINFLNSLDEETFNQVLFEFELNDKKGFDTREKQTALILSNLMVK